MYSLTKSPHLCCFSVRSRLHWSSWVLLSVKSSVTWIQHTCNHGNSRLCIYQISSILSTLLNVQKYPSVAKRNQLLPALVAPPSGRSCPSARLRAPHGMWSDWSLSWNTCGGQVNCHRAFIRNSLYILVVFCRQINSIFVSSGSKISLQTLYLLSVFLQEGTRLVQFRFDDSTWDNAASATLMRVLLVSFWLTSGLFMMFLALLAYSSVLRVSCRYPNIKTYFLNTNMKELGKKNWTDFKVRGGRRHGGNDWCFCSTSEWVLQYSGQLRLSRR